MTTAQLEAGFESASGFRDALARMFPTDIEQTDVLSAAQLSSPLGPMLAVAGDNGIVMLDFMGKSNFESAIERLKGRLKSQQYGIVPGDNPNLTLLEEQLEEYFAGARHDFTVPLDPHGTDFERTVWRFLQKIPYGQTRSYGEQARAIGNPAAVRAVGRANGRNDISILIPCHRVIGASGSLVGYGGGLERKRWLLDHEQRVVGGRLW